jgi:hypothetical protein
VNDRPTGVELLRAVERFLEREVVPGLDGVRRYHARIAANVVAIVARELETEDRHLGAEWLRLGALLSSDDAPPADRDALRARLTERNVELVRRIRAGEADTGAYRARVLAHLHDTVAAKLEVAKPPRIDRD